MNSILQLKGRFEKRKNEAGFGTPKLPAKQKVTSTHMRDLKAQLMEVKAYWETNREIKGALVSVHYIRIVAKSNRLRNLLGDTGKKPVDSICGAKFATKGVSRGEEGRKHIFTHYVQISAIERAIESLENAANIVDQEYKGCITSEDTENLGKNHIYTYDSSSKTISQSIDFNKVLLNDSSLSTKFDNGVKVYSLSYTIIL